MSSDNVPRRRFLRLAGCGGLSISGAGCIDLWSEEETAPTSEETRPPPPNSPAPPKGTSAVTFTGPVVRKAVTYQAGLGSDGVVAEPHRQYVVASVDADEELEREAFELRAGGETWSPSVPGDQSSEGIIAVAGHRGREIGVRFPQNGPWFLAFTVPSPLDVNTAVVRLSMDGETAEWSLDDEAISALSAPGPTFSLQSLDAPDAIDVGDLVDVSLTVENTSDVDGRFLAAVYWPTKGADDDESHIVERQMSAGETATIPITIPTEDTPKGERQLPLSVEGSVTASTRITVHWCPRVLHACL